MKKIDENGLRLCRMQAEVFEQSITKTKCSSPIFLRRYMNSQVAHRMDQTGFAYEACDVDSIFAEIENEFGKSNYGKEKYGNEELYWMGYLYRYWALTYERSSKQIYKIMKPKELRGLYFPYHSLDPSQAIGRILEAKDLREEDFIQRGVEILRKMMYKEENRKEK